MSYLKYKDLKKGDSIIIISRPPYWSSKAGGNIGRDGRDFVEYPYTLIIDDVDNTPGGYIHIAILDTNGYGWAIDNRTVDYIKRNIIIENRLNKIKNLNEL